MSRTLDASPWMRRSAALMIPAALLLPPLASASPEGGLSSSAQDERAPRASCATPGDTTRRCLVVYEYDHPSGDVDVRAQVVQVDGTVVSGLFPLASSYDDETSPAIASMISADAYLLVWEHTAPGGQSEIRAKRIGYDGFAIGSEFTVASSATDERKPAVACSHGECLVVWEHEYGAGDRDIYARRYSNSGTAKGAAFVISKSVKDETRPAVDAFGDESPTYYVAWQTQYAAGDRDISAAFVASASVTSPMTISGSSADETNPVIACRFEYSCFIVHERLYAAGDRDIRGHLLDTSTSAVNPSISSMVLVNTSFDEHSPTIDRDALYDHEFTVAWESDTSATTSEIAVQRRSTGTGSWLAGLSIASSAGSNAEPRRPAIAGSEQDDFLVAWQEVGPTASLDVVADPISFP